MSQQQAGQGEIAVSLRIGEQWQLVYTTQQVADWTDLKVGYIQQLCDMGKLIATKFNGRWWVHSQQENDTYLDIVPF